MHRLLLGDVRARLRHLEPDSVHCVVTSPPYWGLRDYKAVGQVGMEASPIEWVAVMVEIFREIRRVLRPDGVVWLNLGDKYAGSGCGGLNADSTTLQGSVETQNQSKLKRSRRPEECAATQRQASIANVGRRATRMHRMHMEDGDERHTKGIPTHGFRDKQRLLLPARLAIALQDDEWWLRDEVVWFKTNPMPSSVTDRTTPAHEMLYLLAKRPRYFYDALAIAESATYPAGPNTPDAIKSPHGQGFTRYATPSGWDQENERHDIPGQYRGRAAGNKRHRQHEEFEGGSAADRPKAGLLQVANVAYGGRNKRSVWSISTEPFPQAHFATFPTGLVEPCILSGTSHRGACPSCGAPWRRIERVTYSNPGNRKGNGPRSISRKHIEGGSAGFDLRLEREVRTLGWYPTCPCAKLAQLPKPKRVVRRKGETVAQWRQRKEKAAVRWEKAAQPLIDAAGMVPAIPCTVLDPFAGAGTTLLVADRLGRDSIGIEINPEFAQMAQRRLAAENSLFAPRIEPCPE